MTGKISGLGLILSSSPYVRSATARFPFAFSAHSMPGFICKVRPWLSRPCSNWTIKQKKTKKTPPNTHTHTHKMKPFRGSGGNNFFGGIYHCICHIFGNLRVGGVLWCLHVTYCTKHVMYCKSHITHDKERKKNVFFIIF